MGLPSATPKEGGGQKSSDQASKTSGVMIFFAARILRIFFFQKGHDRASSSLRTGQKPTVKWMSANRSNRMLPYEFATCASCSWADLSMAFKKQPFARLCDMLSFKDRLRSESLRMAMVIPSCPVERDRLARVQTHRSTLSGPHLWRVPNGLTP